MLLALRIMLGIIPTCLIAASFLAVYLYPITEAMLSDIQAQLDKKQRGGNGGSGAIVVAHSSA